VKLTDDTSKVTTLEPIAFEAVQVGDEEVTISNPESKGPLEASGEHPPCGA
jgi:hypothetical protein